MHREGSAACNWPLALLVFSLISVLYVGAAIAAPALIVTPPTLTPDKVVSIPGGTCANYSNTVSTSGVVDPNGIHHPGECQLTDFEVLFEGLPFKQYWRNVSFGRLPAPYTVTRVGPVLLRSHQSSRPHLGAGADLAIELVERQASGLGLHERVES
ncbi:MAG TPA: hypothetical protein VIZ19_03920 [Roseiarcus sp.]